MKLAKTKISIIIPTHNRVNSIKRLLDKLGSQTYPVEDMEVIVVANSCTDTTVTMLQNYRAPFQLRYSESSGNGPAVPRNKGASLATGSLLIFLDDDIDPADGFVEAHVLAAQNKKDAVVIGYLPLPRVPKQDYFRINLNTWWEEKFQQMRTPGYRYSYTDLLSGNFSISAELFRKAEGFITGFSCRDDYELGIRLIRLGANFVFCRDAWGLHRDDVTDLNRTLKRKREEGRTDVRIWRIHPGVTTALQDAYVKNKYTFLQSKTAFFLFLWPQMTDIFASCIAHVMPLLEQFSLRSIWKKYNHDLLTYWYYRGLLDESHTRKNLKDYLHYVPQNEKEEELEIDLKEGLEPAIQLIDQLRPHSIRILYGTQIVGSIPVKPGAEPLKGIHLRRILADELSWVLLKTLALEKLINKPVETEEPFHFCYQTEQKTHLKKVS